MDKKIIVDNSLENVRIDKALSTILTFSRTQIESLIKDSKILVNAKPTKASYKLSLND